MEAGGVVEAVENDETAEISEEEVLYNQAYQADWDGDKNKAETLLDELVAQYPDYEPGWALLSQVAGDPQKVENCLRRVLKITPGNLTARTRLIKILDEKEKREPWKIL